MLVLCIAGLNLCYPKHKSTNIHFNLRHFDILSSKIVLNTNDIRLI